MDVKGFIGPAYQARSNRIDCQLAINMYAEMDPTGKNVTAYIGTPGLLLLASIGDGPIRGTIRIDNTKFLVASGNELYQVNDSFESILVGSLAGFGRVKMASNGPQIFIATNPDGYIFQGGVLSAITDPDFPGSSDVGYLDNYFIFLSPNTQQFYITALGDGTNVDALDLASAEGAPDNILALIIDHREALMFGDTSTEGFQDTGNSDFPIERISGAFMEYGIAARHSACKIDNTVYWLGKDENGDLVIYKMSGYTPQRASNHAIEFALSKHTNEEVSAATAYSYQQEGHSFYVLNIGNETWVYDVATGLFHQRAYRNPYRNPLTGDLERHRADNHLLFNGKHIVGDYVNGNLYELDLDYYTDNGQPIRRIRTSPHIHQDQQYLTFSYFQVDFETGVGLSNGQGSDPVAIIKYSNNGGKIWGNPYFAKMGKIGEYNTRCIRRKCGQSNDRAWWVETSEPVKFIMIAASMGIG